MPPLVTTRPAHPPTATRSSSSSSMLWPVSRRFRADVISAGRFTCCLSVLEYCHICNPVHARQDWFCLAEHCNEFCSIYQFYLNNKNMLCFLSGVPSGRANPCHAGRTSCRQGSVFHLGSPHLPSSFIADQPFEGRCQLPAADQNLILHALHAQPLPMSDCLGSYISVTLLKSCCVVVQAYVGPAAAACQAVPSL